MDIYLLFIILGIIIFLGLYLARPVATISVAKKFNHKDKAVIDSLIPKGLAAAVLAQLPAQAGIPGTQLFADVALAVVLISIVVSTIMVFLVEKNKYGGVLNYYQTLLNKRRVNKEQDSKTQGDKI